MPVAAAVVCEIVSRLMLARSLHHALDLRHYLLASELRSLLVGDTTVSGLPMGCGSAAKIRLKCENATALGVSYDSFMLKMVLSE